MKKNTFLFTFLLLTLFSYQSIAFDARIASGVGSVLATTVSERDETYTMYYALPLASRFTAIPSQNSVYPFATANFSYADGDSDPINHLIVTAIPANESLCVEANANDDDAGEELVNGYTVSKANLDAGNLQHSFWHRWYALKIIFS
jgi:hypothetical protein